MEFDKTNIDSFPDGVGWVHLLNKNALLELCVTLNIIHAENPTVQLLRVLVKNKIVTYRTEKVNEILQLQRQNRLEHERRVQEILHPNAVHVQNQNLNAAQPPVMDIAQNEPQSPQHSQAVIEELNRMSTIADLMPLPPPPQSPRSDISLLDSPIPETSENLGNTSDERIRNNALTQENLINFGDNDNNPSIINVPTNQPLMVENTVNWPPPPPPNFQIQDIASNLNHIENQIPKDLFEPSNFNVLQNQTVNQPINSTQTVDTSSVPGITPKETSALNVSDLSIVHDLPHIDTEVDWLL